MKSRSEEKVRLDPIPLGPDLKMIRLPSKFLLKSHHHQKNLLSLKREDDENDTRHPLPLDLEVEILVRLPAKSLMKFRLVSKMWSSFIQSQRFIHSFFTLSLTRSRFTIAVSNGPFPKQLEDHRLFIFSSSYDSEVSSTLVTNLDMTIPSLNMTSACKCASVRGFIGCTNNSGSFVVCNPCTRKVTTLPFHGANTSLGYDPVTDQLKVFSLVTHYHLLHRSSSLVHEVLTFGGGGETSWRRNRFTTPPYYPVTSGICISGFLYQTAWYPRRRHDPVIVCFDVRYETQSFIQAPFDVVVCEGETILIEYKGKLASIVRHPLAPFCRFDLWILEDASKPDWSKQTIELPFSLGIGQSMTSPGTNKAGEIIFAPKYLPLLVEPFYFLYYNVETKGIRKVILHGIADTEDFRRRYGIADHCFVSISAEHVESIASL